MNSLEILICKALIDSNISYNEFVLLNNVLKVFYHKKKKTWIPITSKSSDYITKQRYLEV